MAASNCTPAVSSRRDKYDADFRVPALLGEHSLDHIARSLPTRQVNYRHGSRTFQCAPRRAGKPPRLMEPQGCSAQSSPSRRQEAPFPLQGDPVSNVPRSCYLLWYEYEIIETNEPVRCPRACDLPSRTRPRNTDSDPTNSAVPYAAQAWY
jgi:hypothetical protein